MDNIGVYIDFDNIWASILDNVPTLLLKYNIDEDNEKHIRKEFEYTIDKIIDSIKSNNANIKFIKAFSDFDKLLFIKDVNVIDILHSKGIQTYMPYVRNNKDMSDRALIISTIKDIAIDKRNINKMLLLTGDIDYLPLFEFLSESTIVEFEILSFKNRFNQGYAEVFYLKDKIKFIDTIIERNSLELEDNKKLLMFQKYLENNNIDVKKERVDIKKTIRELNNEYYCRFEHNRIKKFISKLKNA
jgi:hypothetical protein